jgi:hypothetical protein|tara:strand:- start:1662 stop:1898 length:237 start_codon:yes stop_codon:yes gene_type:complete
MTVHRYEVGLLVDGVEKLIECDDTYPDVHDWKTAVEFAMLLIKHGSPHSKVELLFSKDFESEEYEGYDYIHSTPPVIM